MITEWKTEQKHKVVNVSQYKLSKEIVSYMFHCKTPNITHTFPYVENTQLPKNKQII